MPTAMNKLNTLKSWLETACSLRNFELQPLVNEASFRQYFRVQMDNNSHIVMFAPPDKEDITAFISIAKNFTSQGIHAPNILNYHLEQGFILLSDLGNDLYFNLLNTETADDLYTRALAVIPQIQACEPKLANNQPLGLFDEKFIRVELNLFPDWFLGNHLNLIMTPKLSASLEKIFQLLITSALKQPRVCVHRDYHSRNLLLIDKEKVGILDFQDAIYGPITYDAVSLLRDAYIDWPEAQVEKWTLNFHDMLMPKHSFSSEEFIRWFDLIGIQRHLKVLGIFARLCYRDNKPQYLTSTSRLLRYLQQVCEKYPELIELKHLLPNIHNKLSET
ncbi:aminoglycoside phosphotransferase family protein [Rickettsiella endosymbiont of Dermanyssus gallinae]|uniref:aminoglycoside phosphotransferase family protein n=1 Tax=Rickettsiella endosymbiont of Dermanyssus gallinae TaxID=2856608 RepID=UPI001C52DC2F|nr:phosphotransferase [Rickettsiella endosymbiont of Dermanyssus gallinae]